MKKIFMIAAAVAGLFATAACQKEIQNPMNGREGSVSLTVEVPANLQTKAMSDATNTDIVYFEIWNSDWSTKLYPTDPSHENSKGMVQQDGKMTASIDLELINNQTYNFIFWAQNEACGAYDVTDLKYVKVDYSVMNGNNDAFDAFYAVKPITVNGAISETVTLYRPFAQLNFAASKMQSLFGNINLEATEVTVSGLSTVFNTVEGVGEDPADASATYTATGMATTEMLETDGGSYHWVTMDYMLMPGIKTNVEVTATFSIAGMPNPIKHAVSNVPLKKNYRTNIVGELFTAGAELKVVVDPAFQKPDENITYGIAEEPAYDDQTKTYSIQTAGNVIWLAAQPKDFAAGKTISFDANIDMMGQTISPIKASSASTNGTPVYGNGKTISNFIVKSTGRNSAGLFGDHKGSISDLHVENVVVYGEYKAGALVGSVYGNVTGCSAKNVKVISVPYADGASYDGGNHVGALVGYSGEGSVKNNKYYTYSDNLVDGALIKAYRNVAGLIGTVQSYVIVEGNRVRNVDVVLDQLTNYYGDKDENVGEVGGFIMSNSDIRTNEVENVTISRMVSSIGADAQYNVDLTENIAYANTPFMFSTDATSDYVIDGNGKSVILLADSDEDMTYTSFSSANKNNVIIQDITFKGEFNFIAAGFYYEGPNKAGEIHYHTTLNNVNILDARVTPVVVAHALLCDGETVLNNCTVTGTQLSDFATFSPKVYDVATWNYSHTTINGGKFGVVGSFANAPQATLVVNGAEIGTIENRYIARNGYPTRGLYINGSSKIDTINTYGSTSDALNKGQWTHIEIEAGAEVGTLTFDNKSVSNLHFTSEWIKIADGTVGKVIADGEEMTLADFKARYNL